MSNNLATLAAQTPYTVEELESFIEKFSPSKPKKIDEYLLDVNYNDKRIIYQPSEFAVHFVNTVKMINGKQGEEHSTPITHYEILDDLAAHEQYILQLVHRGGAKSTLAEYEFLYIALYGRLAPHGSILNIDVENTLWHNYAMYIGDSIDNGVATMRKNLKNRFENSEFLNKYLEANIKETEWYFKTKFIDPRIGRHREFVVQGFGADSGIRGTREFNERPTMVIIDDIIKDKAAKSPTMLKTIKDTVSGTIDYALHPTKRLVQWLGTPFNEADPITSAAESGAYKTHVYPVAARFPCTEEEFNGSWPDRFSFNTIMKQYVKALMTGELDAFYREMMLRTTSDENRLIPNSCIMWYTEDELDLSRANIYITTDMATTDKESSDYNVIMVWAVDHRGVYHLIDGIRAQQLVGETLDQIIMFVRKYNPISVGIEVTGQQGAFMQWLQDKMVETDTFFNIANQIHTKVPGIRPTSNKFGRFVTAVPMFKAHNIRMPKHLSESELVTGFIHEISLATKDGFKSKNDDTLDGFSMLKSMHISIPDGGTVSDHYGRIANQEESAFTTRNPYNREFDSVMDTTTFGATLSADQKRKRYIA